MTDTNTLSQILELRNAVADIASTLAGLKQALDEAKAPKPSVEPIARNKTRLLINSDWPRVGGRDFEPAPTSLFNSDAFREAYQPGGHTRAIYFGACEGLGYIASALQLPLFKVGTCGSARVHTRMDEMKKDKYGAVRRVGNEYVVDPKWDTWFNSHLRAGELPSRNSPVRCETRIILVDLPKGMIPEDFDRAFDAEVAKGALDRWLLTEEGRNHAAALNVDPAIGQRLTAYPGGDTQKLSPATEICVIHTYECGTDRLIAIAEAVILRYLGLID